MEEATSFLEWSRLMIINIVKILIEKVEDS